MWLRPCFGFNPDDLEDIVAEKPLIPNDCRITYILSCHPLDKWQALHTQGIHCAALYPSKSCSVINFHIQWGGSERAPGFLTRNLELAPRVIRRAGEIAYNVRLKEDLSSFPSTHIRHPQLPITPAPRRSSASGLHRHLNTHVHTHMCIAKNNKGKSFLKKKVREEWRQGQGGVLGRWIQELRSQDAECRSTCPI